MCAEPSVHHVHSLLVDAALDESRKSGAMYESGAKYKLRFFRATIFLVPVTDHTLWYTTRAASRRSSAS